MHSVARYAAASEPPLLARINPFAPGSLETRLIYPANTPSGNFEKFKRLLLTPLMQWEARQQVRSFLGRQDIWQLDAAKALAQRLDRNPFRTVSAAELSAVLAEATLKKISIPGTLRTLTRAYFQHPDNLAAACREQLGQLTESESRALDALIAFVRDPKAPLNRRDCYGIKKLLDKTTHMELPAELDTVLTDYLSRYLKVYDQAVRINSGLVDGEDSESLVRAFDELHACLPVAAGPGLEALQRFCESGRIGNEDRPLLQRVWPLLAHHAVGLSQETLRQLLPRMIAVEDAVTGKTLIRALQLPEHLTSDEHALAFSLLLALRESDSKYSPAAATSLIEYIASKSRIHALKADIQRSEGLLAAATQHASAMFGKQKLAALRKRRLPGKASKKKVLAYKPAWKASSQNLAVTRAELADLQRRLINTESRMRLAYVVLNPDRLMQSLPSANTKEIARRVLHELAGDLKNEMANGAPTGVSAAAIPVMPKVSSV